MYLGLCIKYPLFLSDISETWNILDRFSKNTQISNFMKLRPAGAELVRADERTNGQANKTKVRVARLKFISVFCADPITNSDG